MSPATPEELAGRLVLARLLLPAKKAPTVAAVQKNLAPLFTHRMSGAEWNELFARALQRLVEAEHVTSKPLALTETGRAFTLAYWQIDRLPPKISWIALRNQYLASRVLGLSQQHRGEKITQTRLVASVLKARHRLPAEVAETARGVVTGLAWKQLNIDSTAAFTPEAVVARLLLKSTRKVSAADVAKQLARIELDTTGNDLFVGALRQWIAGGPPDARTEADDDPRRFSERVLLAARQSPSGRFGGDKIFISHVWKQLANGEGPSGLPLAEFKDRLVAAHRAGLLELSRADLVERMDPVDVSQSETKYLDARFHFVRLDS
ncbi:MAG TPA: hypothetical protein VL475_09485 [Planctomycetaceae bacterium]|nr:hypothetical protein [Planctomycetaceae bacterium]